MKHYTVDADEAIDRQIAADLAHIVAEVQGLGLPGLGAVVLLGGFGRGEGGVVRTAEGHRAFNDYDLMLVFDELEGSKAWAYNRELDRLGRRLAGELGIHRVEMALARRKDLPALPPTIFWYEAKKGHRVIWGDPRVFDAVPDYAPKDIPLAEGTRLLLVRGSDLLRAGILLVPDSPLTEEDRGLIAMHFSKAALALGDAVLLLEGRYHWSYRQRVELLEAIYAEGRGGHDPEILSLYGSACQFKLRPDPGRMLGGDLKAQWLQLRHLHERFFRSYESRRLKREFANWPDYIRFYGQHLDNHLPWSWKRLARRLLAPWRRRRAIPEARLFAVLPFLLYSIDEGGVNADLLAHAAGLLGGSRAQDSRRRWVELSSRYIELWHP